jgi:hypothetical protein
VYFVLRCDLCERLCFSQRLEDNLGFEGRAMLLSHGVYFGFPNFLEKPFGLCDFLEPLHCLYHDRWAVEHLSLVGKPLLGCGSAFVFGQESRLRLPELALLSGNVLSYVAATCSAVATGFWDRACRVTCDRLRRVLLGGQLRKKASVTSHLKTGVEGHRRQKASKAMLGSLEMAAI